MKSKEEFEKSFFFFFVKYGEMGVERRGSKYSKHFTK